MYSRSPCSVTKCWDFSLVHVVGGSSKGRTMFFKCLSALSVPRWSLWLWHCWQTQNISEAKKNPTRTKHSGFEWMPGKEWKQAKLYICCKNMPAFICSGHFLNQTFLSVQEYLSLAFLWCFSGSRQTASIYTFWQEVLPAQWDIVWRAPSSCLFWSWVLLYCVILLSGTCGDLVVTQGELTFFCSFHVTSYTSSLNIPSLLQPLDALDDGELLNSSAGQGHLSYLCHSSGVLWYALQPKSVQF